MVVTGPENIFYLTGQQTPGYYMFQALVLPVEGDPVFIIRQLEYFNFVANTFIADAAIYQDNEDPIAFLTKVLADKGLAGQARRNRQARLVPSDRGLRSDAARVGRHRQTRPASSRACAWSNRRPELDKLERAATYVDAGISAGAAAVRLGIPRMTWSPR